VCCQEAAGAGENGGWHRRLPSRLREVESEQVGMAQLRLQSAIVLAAVLKGAGGEAWHEWQVCTHAKCVA